MKFFINNLIQRIVFLKESLLFLKFTDEITFSEPTNEKNIGILATLWPSRTLIFYSLALALLIKIKKYPIVIIYDDLAEALFPKFAKRARKIILKLKKRIPSLRIIFLSAIPEKELSNDDIREITKLAEFNSYYVLKTTVPVANSQQEINKFLSLLQNPAKRIKNLFDAFEFSTFIVPGGVFGFTGLYRYFGNSKNTRVATFDSGPNKVIIGTTDIAAHLKDIPNIILGIQDISQYNIHINHAKHELARRFSGLDHYHYQKVKFDEYAPTEQFDILIPLNIEIDTAAFTSNSNFKNLYNWLDGTIQFLLQNTTAVILIKEHPSIYNRSEHLKNSITEKYSHNERVIYFDKDKRVNTYKLILEAKLILPFTSTVGIEAAILGKTVIVESGVYYRKLPFVLHAESKQDYFDKIKYYLKNEFIIDDNKLNYAYLCYYFTQVCNFLTTDFTPQDSDYNNWVKKKFSQLSNECSVELQVESFIKGIPLAKLNHERVLRSA